MGLQVSGKKPVLVTLRCQVQTTHKEIRKLCLTLLDADVNGKVCWRLAMCIQVTKTWLASRTDISSVKLNLSGLLNLTAWEAVL